MINNEIALAKISEKFGANILSSSEEYGMLIIETNRESIRSIIEFIRDEESFKIDFFTTMAGLHYPDNKELDSKYFFQYRIHIVILFVTSTTQPTGKSVRNLTSSESYSTGIQILEEY
jgi:hypothetical protein